MKPRAVIFQILLLLIAGSCRSSGEVSDPTQSVEWEKPVSTSTTQAVPPSMPDPEILVWNRTQIVGDGVELPPLGSIEPGVLLTADFKAAGPGETTSLVELSACRNPAPGRWVIDGTVRGQGRSTFTLGVEQQIEDMIVQSTVELTFSGAGEFSFPFVPIWAESSRDPLRSLELDASVTSCSLYSDRSIAPVLSQRYDEIPTWDAPLDSIQGYPLFDRSPEGSHLSRSISAAVWFGSEVPFASLLLPSHDVGWGGILMSNRPECRSVEYKTIALPTVSVRHVAGGCEDNSPVTGPVVDLQHWNWIQSSVGFARASRPLNDSVVDVFGPDRASVVKVLKSLIELDNRASFEIVGPASADEAIEARLALLREIEPSAVFTQRARVETENLVTVAYTSVQPAICNGCSGDDLRWGQVVVEKKSGVWFARGGSGESWDECLGISSWSSAGQFSARSVLAGQPTWTIEELRDGEWVQVDANAGYWIETGDGTNPAGLPTVRTRDDNGEVQDCALSNFVPIAN